MDDELAIRALVSTMLTRRGVRVSAAADGEEAIGLYEQARAEGEPFDLVILDLTVPGGMGGKQTLERLLELDPEVQAVVSSGYSGDAAMAAHRELGFVAVLAKPYSPDDLVALVERLIRRDPRP
jgi:CheY-like chemotaxis protein